MIGPLQAQQVVLRAVCYGAAEVRWVLERVDTEDAPESASDPAEESVGADDTAEADRGTSAIVAAPDLGDEPT